MPRTISRVLSENISNSGDNSRMGSRIGSRISSVSKWLSSKNGDAETTVDTTVGGHPLSSTTVSGPSKPQPMLHPVPSRPSASDEDTLSQEDAMPARRREIRFYDEPEPRPSDLVVSPSEAPQDNASTSGGKLPEPESMETRP